MREKLLRLLKRLRSRSCSTRSAVWTCMIHSTRVRTDPIENTGSHLFQPYRCCGLRAGHSKQSNNNAGVFDWNPSLTTRRTGQMKWNKRGVCLTVQRVIRDQIAVVNRSVTDGNTTTCRLSKGRLGVDKWADPSPSIATAAGLWPSLSSHGAVRFSLWLLNSEGFAVHFFFF